MDISELNELYGKAETAHRRLFAEQRSNLKLVAGDHYNKRDSHFWRELRRTEGIDRKQKVRLVKNHLQRIVKSAKNNILSFAPDVTIVPQNDREIQDRKAAELNSSVWEYNKRILKYEKRLREFVDDYIEIGEVFVELGWDPEMGAVAEYQMVPDEFGQPQLDEQGQPVTIPIRTGIMEWNRILGFNALMDPGARSWEETRYTCIRKMSDIKPLVMRYAEDEKKTKMIQESSKTTYKIFDNNTGEYSDSKGLCMLRTYYFRPTPEEPSGYYYITTEFGILEEGPIPLGEDQYPILKCGYDDLVTSPRSQSIIKPLRPVQAEVNRSASKMAEHQMTLGDDKIITQAGATLSAGATKHGIKHIKVSGPEPKILAGRSGEQYLGYMKESIAEMYEISNMLEDSAENQTQVDPYALLFRSASQKKKFMIYIKKFEEFLVELCEATIKYNKAFLNDNTALPIVGKSEQANIPEFKSTTDLHFQVKVTKQSGDIHTQLGKQIALRETMQYGSGVLSEQTMGKIIRAMPYLNDEKIMDELTLDHDNAENDILALDRGELPEPEENENHTYLLTRLVHRMKQPDFKFLNPQIQDNYRRKRQMHLEIQANQERQRQMAEQGMIPAGGYMVTCDLYIPNPTDPTKQKRLRISSKALEWLVEKLEQQGAMLSQYDNLDEATRNELLLRSQKQQLGPQGQGGQVIPGPGIVN